MSDLEIVLLTTFLSLLINFGGRLLSTHHEKRRQRKEQFLAYPEIPGEDA